MEILGLDDYLVLSLISHIAESVGEDPTLTDLAQRLVRRKLFKIVRCDDRQVDSLVEQTNLTQLLTRLGNALPGKDASFYYKVERSPMSLFSDDEAGYSYFLDSNREASPIRDHHLLRAWTDQPARRFLFVPEEARKSVEALLQQSR